MKMLSVGILIVDRDYFCGHCLYLVSRTGVKLFNRTLYLVSLFSRSSELSDCLLRLWWLWWRDWHGARGVSLQRTTTRNEGAESLIGIKKCSSIFYSTGQSKQHLIKRTIKMWLVIVLHVVRMWGHVMFSHNAQLMCVIPGVVRPASRGHCSLSPFSLKNLIWSRISPGICVLLLESHTRWQRSQIREINLPAMDVCGTNKFFLIRQFGFREGLKKGGIFILIFFMKYIHLRIHCSWIT